MIYMRSILKALMDSKGHTGHSLYELSGVPPATTYRFLSGNHGEPRSETIRRWARVYGVTEAQMRGSEPIEDLPVKNPGEAPMTLESVLTQDELAAIEGMRKLDKETRRSWLRLTKLLCNNTAKPRAKGSDTRVTTDRRQGGKRCLAPGSSGPKYTIQTELDNGGILGEPKTA